MNIYSFIITFAFLLFLFYMKSRAPYTSEIGTVLYLIKRIHYFVLVFIFILIYIFAVASKLNIFDGSFQELALEFGGLLLYSIIGLVITTDYYFISDTGIGMMNFIKRVNYIVKWKDIDSWYMEKCFNSEKLSYCIRLKDNSRKYYWLLNKIDKEKVEQIIKKYIDEEHQF